MSVLEPLPPGSTIGILGGGQLGKMLAIAAAQLGFKTLVWTDRSDDPALDVATEIFVAPYTDLESVNTFMQNGPRVITYEFENIPVDTTFYLNSSISVHPNPSALSVIQDRLLERRFLTSLNIPVSPYIEVNNFNDVERAVNTVGLPAVLKTRRFGYDGKGQVIVENSLGEAEAAWRDIGEIPSIFEKKINFSYEASVIAARGLDGKVSSYDLVRNVHCDHILAKSYVPAGLEPNFTEYLTKTAEKILNQFNYIGVLAVEFFINTDNGFQFYVNEIAPRVHNSGHWTLDACYTSQFEQHIRAITGWPLGSTHRHSNVIMENLLGESVHEWKYIAQQPMTALHIYGKTKAVSGRKMGHMTRLYPTSLTSPIDSTK